MKKLSLFTIFSLVLVGSFMLLAPKVEAVISAVTVTAPNTAVYWKGPQNITWTTTPGADPGTVNIYYCTGSGCSAGTYTLISGAEANDGTYSWNTAAGPGTYPDGSTYRIRVGASADPLLIGDNSDTTFTVDNTAPTTSGAITSGTLGNNSYYTTDVGYTITPTDATSGVASTAYCTDTTNACSPGTSYSGGEITLSTAGNNYVRFKSTDNAGNVQTTQSSGLIKIDKTNPVVDAGSDAATNTLPHTLAATVSDATSGVATYAWSQVSGPGTVTFSNAAIEDGVISAISQEGTYVLLLTVTDAAGNTNSDTMTLVYDTTAPTIIAASIVGTTVNGGNDTVVMHFSEAVTPTTNWPAAFTNIKPTGGSNLTLPAAGSFSYVDTLSDHTLTMTLSENVTSATTYLRNGTTITVTPKVSEIKDVANNYVAITPVVGDALITGDTTPPTVALTYSPDQTSYKAGVHVTVTATFDEAIHETVLPTIAVATNGNGGVTATNMTKSSNTVYTYDWTVPAGSDDDGTATFTIAATDLAGNANVTATNNTKTVDNTAPTVGIALSDYALKVGDTATVTMTFSEAPTGFTSADVTTPNGTLTDFTVTGNPLIYTATLTPDSATTDTTNLVTIGTVWTDAAGNAPVGSTNSTNYIVDTVVPTVVLSHTHGDTIVRDADTDTFTATFTDAGGLSGTPTITIGSVVTAADMTATGDPLVWTYAWNVPAGNDGAQAISVSASDVGGNANAAATGVTSETIDNTAPTVSAGANAGDKFAMFTHTDPTATDANEITTYAWTKVSGTGDITFSSASTLNPGNISVTAGAYDNYVARLSVTDVAGNVGTSDFTFSWLPATGLVATSFSPANASTSVAITNGTATVTFNSNITLLDATKVTLVDNGTGTSKKGTVVVSGGNGTSAILNIPYTGLANNTTYRINIAQSAVRDGSNNTNAATVSYFTTVASDTASLAVTQVGAVANPSSVVGAATNDNTFANGFAWTFNVTVPTSETKLKLKFSDFVNGSSSIPATNIRYCSVESSNATCASESESSANFVVVGAANAYTSQTIGGVASTGLTLANDLASGTPGRQVTVRVEMKVPASTPGGSYSGTYGVNSVTP